jgi:AraC family transcriptional regulator of adaptative response / DNA-3-methyladenine glycosylase II
VSVGVTSARGRTLRALAEEVASGKLDLDAPADPTAAVEALQRVPGIGAWTASYVAMRAFGAPDAFPSGDRALCRALRLSASALEARAAAWSPWRAYAALHIWNGESR